jgi:uncharacterized protein
MLYIIYNEDREDGAAIRAAQREPHFAYLHSHEDSLILAGAMLGEDGEKRLGSVFLLNLPNRQAAEEFSRNEPFTKAGLFKSTKITRMRRGQWNPAAAPKTAEGH